MSPADTREALNQLWARAAMLVVGLDPEGPRDRSDAKILDDGWAAYTAAKSIRDDIQALRDKVRP